MLENFTPLQLAAAVIGVILAVASFVNQVGSAVEKVSKARKAATAPIDDIRDRVEKLEQWQTETDRKLGRDYAELKNMQTGNRAIFQALLALLDHGIDGNNITQMENAKTALQDHLIGK